MKQLANSVQKVIDSVSQYLNVCQQIRCILCGQQFCLVQVLVLHTQLMVCFHVLP